MVYFILFLILIIVVHAFFVTAAPVRVTRPTDITEPQARKTLAPGRTDHSLECSSESVSNLQNSFPQTGVWLPGNEDCSRMFHFSMLVLSTQQQKSAITRFPNMEGLTSLCDALNLSQQLLKVNNTQLLFPSRSTDMPVSGSVAMPYALLSFQYIDNASQHSTMH